jgi:Electron transfer DM13
MKYLNLLAATLISTFTISSTILFDSGLQSAKAESAKAPTITTALYLSSIEVLSKGSFVASEHPTKGLAEVVMQNGKKYLRLDKNFKSENGPDLFVLLHRQDTPKDYQKTDYVSLGRLKKLAGKQLYAIPANVDVTEFKSVVIWCRQFKATFGFATLG